MSTDSAICNKYLSQLVKHEREACSQSIRECRQCKCTIALENSRFAELVEHDLAADADLRHRVDGRQDVVALGAELRTVEFTLVLLINNRQLFLVIVTPKRFKRHALLRIYT